MYPHTLNEHVTNYDGPRTSFIKDKYSCVLSVIILLCNNLVTLLIRAPDKRDGWMTCDFTSFLTVFRSYQDDVWMIMKGCVQGNSVCGCPDKRGYRG